MQVLVQEQPQAQQELLQGLQQAQPWEPRWHHRNPQQQWPESSLHHASKVRWYRFSRLYRQQHASCRQIGHRQQL